MKNCSSCERFQQTHATAALQQPGLPVSLEGKPLPIPTSSNWLIIGEVVVIGLLVALVFIWKSGYIGKQLVPVWDGNVYLLDAHDLLTGHQLYEWFRPLLMPGIIAAVWSLTGETYLPVRFFNLTFTLATVLFFYFLTRSQFGRVMSLLAAIVYLTSYQILIWSDQLLVQGLTSLFAISTLAILSKNTSARSVLGGVFAALTCLVRYTSVAIAFPIIAAYAIRVRGRPNLIALTVLGACVPLLIYHVAFPFVFPHFLQIWFVYGETTGNTSLPYYYYLTHWYSLFGIVGLFGLPALILPSTYKSNSSRPWAFWLIGSLIFFTITMNKQDRFTFEWTPAVVYLSFLILIKIENRLISGDGSWMRSKSRSLRKLIFGAALVCLVVLQAYASVSAYLQLVESPGYYRDNNLLTVADYLKIHIPSNATFMSDYDAPALTYFSGRYGFAIYLPTSDSRFLEYLHNYMRSTHTRYLLVFPSLTGNSVNVLEDSGFLALADTIKVTSIGPVYFFRSTT
jgi:4-amino-4-deoxy-L-arabinose transferase-like glycosyltransferase